MRPQLTKSQSEPLRWLSDRNGDGVFDKNGVLLAAGQLAPFMRSTWNELRSTGLLEFYNPTGKGRGRAPDPRARRKGINMATLHLPGIYGPGGMKQDFSDLARDGVILSLWKDGKDTCSIAASLNMRHCDVANRLAWLRDQGAK